MTATKINTTTIEAISALLGAHLAFDPIMLPGSHPQPRRRAAVEPTAGTIKAAG